MYGLLQAGKITNDNLVQYLETYGYHQSKTTDGLFTHNGRDVSFTLIVDDFGVEYVGKEHADHLRDTIKEFYDLTENWDGDLYAGINLDWNYTKRTCWLSMEDYNRGFSSICAQN